MSEGSALVVAAEIAAFLHLLRAFGAGDVEAAEGAHLDRKYEAKLGHFLLFAKVVLDYGVFGRQARQLHVVHNGQKGDVHGRVL